MFSWIIGCLCLLLPLNYIEAYGSCRAIYLANNQNPSGSYIITHNGQNIKVYCSFEGSWGYTYISRNYYTQGIDFSQFYTTRDFAKIRIRYSSGAQREVTVQNLPSYSNTMFFARNSHTSYAAPDSSNNAMHPYIYMGFLPISKVANYNNQGYRAAGTDFWFSNCDANPNSYISFYFNPNNRSPGRLGGSSSFMTGWMDRSSSLSSGMPSEFFFDWEMHMGGCGGFMTSHSVSNTQASLGVAFAIQPCDGVHCQNGGNCYASGSTGVCNCPSSFHGNRCQNRDGGWSGYSYTSCSVTCGGGSRTKSRSCNNPSPLGSGATCSGAASATEACNTHACPINGGWTNWSAWNTCSLTCGGGSQSRSRSCTNPSPAHGGLSCSGTTSDSQACNTHNCPIDGGLTTWTSWGSCTVTCGGGSQERTRSCTNPAPQYGGAACVGATSGTQACNTHNCPIDGAFTTWTSWGSCTVTCGGGSQERTRSCTNPAPQYGGAACVGATSGTQACNTHDCPIDGGYTAWTSWDTCTVTCGGGSQTKTRTCTNPTPQYGGANCTGSTSATQACNSHNCPIDGGFTTWTSWGSCTVTCGGGSQERTRSCTNPAPQYGGAACVGATSGTQACNTHNCPIDGGWTVWTSWDTCSVTCGGGFQTKTRTCTNPTPQYGGANCAGSTSSTQACNTHHCPIDGGLTTWTSWGSCTVTCGGGSQERTRSCTNPAPQYGGAACVGATSGTQACNTQVCIIDGNWSAWSAFGTCSLTCGGGRASRSRTCSDPAPANGGLNCVGDASDYGDCNTQACPTAAPGVYVQLCPTNWFTCQSGSVSCISGSFACDCQSDCEDGSDETTSYAGCSIPLSECSGASGTLMSLTVMVGSMMITLLTMQW